MAPLLRALCGSVLHATPSKTKCANVVFVSDSFQGNCMQFKVKSYKLQSGLTANSVSLGAGVGMGERDDFW